VNNEEKLEAISGAVADEKIKAAMEDARQEFEDLMVEVKDDNGGTLSDEHQFMLWGLAAAMGEACYAEFKARSALFMAILRVRDLEKELAELKAKA